MSHYYKAKVHTRILRAPELKRSQVLGAGVFGTLDKVGNAFIYENYQVLFFLFTFDSDQTVSVIMTV